MLKTSSLTLAIFVLMCHSLSAEQPQPPLQYAIALHGGAGGNPDRLSDQRRAATEASLKKALAIGTEILQQGGSSLDAVEQVIRHLEDDPLFNAGRGAVFNAAGGHELDASIMDGRTRACGAVAGAKTVKNPISVARLVMTQTRHVILAGDGADKFAKEMGAALVDQQYFFTQERYEALQRAQKEQGGEKQSGGERDGEEEENKGTVGCVALDQHGNLAAGTSTGGLTNKMFGRVGDSPIVGAGTYADNATCAVSCTGVGEHFIRNAVAYDVSARMAYKGQSVSQSVGALIHDVLQPGYGGIIAVSHDGQISMQFNTEGMARAAADSSGRLEIALGR